MKIVNKKCSVVCHFEANGKINPIRIRISNEDQEYTVIKIDKVIKQDLIKEYGKEYLRYTCQGAVQDLIKIFELRFYIKDLTWILYKI